jgi:hypothetical protein
MELRGLTPANVTMIDSWMGAPQRVPFHPLDDGALLQIFLRDLLAVDELPSDFAALRQLDDSARPQYAVKIMKQLGTIGADLSLSEFLALLAEYHANYNALINHEPRPTITPVRLYRATRSRAFPLLVPFALPETGNMQIIDREEDHFSIIALEPLRNIVVEALSSAEAVYRP